MSARVCIAAFALALYGQTTTTPKPRVTPPDSTGKYWDASDKTWKLRGDGACVYKEIKFQGDAECVNAGSTRTLPEFAYRSVKLFGKVKRLEVTASQDDSNGKPQTLSYDADWTEPEALDRSRPWSEVPPGWPSNMIPRLTSRIRAL